jgi:hypothetical protein
VTLGATATNAKICYDPSSSGFYTDTSLTITSATTSISSVDVDKVVKGDTITFTFSGFGLDNHVAVKVIGSGDTCSSSASHTVDGVGGGSTASGYSLTSTAVDKTTATRSWTLAEAGTSFKICFLVATANYGGTGAYADTGGSDVVTVAEMTSRSPSQIGLYVGTTMTLAGIGLSTGDKVALSTSTACTGSWTTNVHDVSLASATSVLVTAQAVASTAYMCLKVAGSAAYYYAGHSIVVATPTMNSITPVKIVKGDLISFAVAGFGLGTFIKIRVVPSSTGCSGSSDASTIVGGAGVAMTVADPSEKVSCCCFFFVFLF